MTYSLRSLAQPLSCSPKNERGDYRYAILAFDHAAFILDRSISFLDKKTGDLLKRKIAHVMTDETFFSQLSPSDAFRVGFMAGKITVKRDEITKVLGIGCAY